MRALDRSLFICECNSIDHQFVFTLDPDGEWPECYLEVHLGTWRGFWRRLWRGLRYAFGYKSRYGAFDEVTISPSDAVRIRDLMDAFIGTDGAKKANAEAGK